MSVVSLSPINFIWSNKKIQQNKTLNLQSLNICAYLISLLSIVLLKSIVIKLSPGKSFCRIENKVQFKVASSISPTLKEQMSSVFIKLWQIASLSFLEVILTS